MDLSFFKRRVAATTPMRWTHGLKGYGGRSIVEADTGKVRGHAYQLQGEQWWAVADFTPLDCFATMEDAMRAVEKKLGANV